MSFHDLYHYGGSNLKIQILLFASRGKSSLLTSWRIDSFLTSTHASSNGSGVISHTSLCPSVMKPLFLQDRAHVTSNGASQIHWHEILSSSQLYLILVASQNCFTNSYPCSLNRNTFLIQSFDHCFCFSSDVSRNWSNFLWFIFFHV